MRILHNAQIHTLDPYNPIVSALAIDHGKIIALGSDDLILSEFQNSKKLHDLNGRTIIPGLTDAHFHLRHYALGLKKIDCDVPTKAECIQRVAEQVRSSEPGKWILGHGWNQNSWDCGFGSADDLDAVAPHNPVYLTAKSLHSAWVNTAALRVSGVSSTTPNPIDGVIQRDVHGNPIGILLEGAVKLITNFIPEPTIIEVVDAILTAQDKLLEMGITGVHDFDRDICFTALQRLHAVDKLKIRVLKSIPLENLSQAVEIGLRSGFGDDLLRIGGVKMFTDGALGPYTAATLQPYENDVGNSGMLLMDRDEIFEHGSLAVKNGLSLAIHAIGDRANREALRAFEKLRSLEVEQSNGVGLSPITNRSYSNRLRHRIEHVQLLDSEDSHCLADSGIIASMQPIHATSDMQMADDYWGYRATFSYAWRTQLNHGAILAFGSDAPVESPNPFWGIHACVTRQRLDGTPGTEGWYPDQRLSIREAIRGYTRGPAFAAGMEDRLGKLAVGYLADLLVLNRDIMRCKPDNIHELSPYATMVGGEWSTTSSIG